MTITNTPLTRQDYQLAFTLPAYDPAHCEHCNDMATIQDGIQSHVRLLLEAHDAVDLVTLDLRYLATAVMDEAGDLHTYDRLAAEETITHYTDPVHAPAYGGGRQYAKN